MDDTGFLSKIVAGLGAAVTALATWAWAHTHSRIDMKADKESFDKLSLHVENHTISRELFTQHVADDERRLTDINAEIKIARSVTGEIFKQMRDMEKTAAVNHSDILRAIGELKR